ncbi:DUF7005 family protein [Iningainema tapete]|uniref:Uncharacterized protein n=1 Tax=Iningainema tapete BLCC-T55 TaxID=2748662 RepID=A0A8J7CH17_9CYAN|nr:hypothetical protein [Iningainema tapete]MBD2777105.1 hypothetical protein [Iningainema tapete BLCC-T55]
MNNLQLRNNVLAAFGASDSEMIELLAYNQNVFELSQCQIPQIPPEPEAHVAAWEEYEQVAQTVGAYTVLKQRLVQFQFPILAGISETEEYRAATRSGTPANGMARATGLILSEPEKLQIQLHQTLAGAIPVIKAGNRCDFVTLVQALTQRNEPSPVPDSMGACIVSGYNNWDRVNQYRQEWEARETGVDWASEFKRLIPRKELYQDRFIILSSGPYSNVAASELELTESQWRQLSTQIRLEHECTHYFTRRFLGVMRNNLIDELIADYRGIVAALGYYRADWFLHFIGLESTIYREGGRLQNYRGEPPLSDGAFKILQALVKSAAENLECFDQQFIGQHRNLAEQVSILMALTTLTLEELACESGKSILEAAYRHQHQLHADQS